MEVRRGTGAATTIAVIDLQVPQLTGSSSRSIVASYRRWLTRSPDVCLVAVIWDPNDPSSERNPARAPSRTRTGDACTV
jgi:hypothetical protein